MAQSLRFALLWPALALALTTACKPAAESDGSAHGDSTATAPTAAAADVEHAPEVASGAAAEAHDAHGAQDAQDAQTLRTIMQGLTADMQAFAQALYVGDSVTMVARAASMAGHANILPEDLRRIQATLGSDMAAFNAADERVNLDAQRLHELALAGQLDAAARQVGAVSQGCVACHTQFREKLRTDRP